MFVNRASFIWASFHNRCNIFEHIWLKSEADEKLCQGPSYQIACSGVVISTMMVRSVIVGAIAMYDYT